MRETSSSRSVLRGKTAAGEIVEVQGGHIVRSTGRKDRHSKVCTAKGPRDRRVRLAAHTAIQFYDVQDRLGYDRPSKAVDWLIKKAKAAIDELAELPAWHPTAFDPENAQNKLEDENQQGTNMHRQGDLMISNFSGSSSKRPTMAMLAGGGEENEQRDLHMAGNSSNAQIPSFLPPSLDSDAIADTIKSFFPMGAAGEASSSAMQFHNFSTHDLLSRNSNNSNSQDLRLSLQSFQDPILLHHHQHHNGPAHSNPSHHPEQQPPPHSQARAQTGQQIVLSGTPLGFDGSVNWPPSEHHQRLPPWNSGDTSTAGFLFNSPPQQLLGDHHHHHHNQFFTSSQRGPLQSSNTPSLRAWMDPPSSADHQYPGGALPVYPPSISSGIGFGSGYGGFSGFHIPARIQGDEEEHDGYSDKPSSASSDSRH